MKKTYMSPKAFEIKISTHNIMGASQNPEGFNKTLDNENTITSGDMLSRRHQDVWEDEEEEDW